MAPLLDRLKNLEKLPWIPFLSVAAGGFVTASVVTTSVSYWMLPKDVGPIKPVRANMASATDLAIDDNPTLDQQALDNIFKRNIFNSSGELEEKDKHGPQEPKDGEDAAKSSLALKLLGTLYGGDPFSGIAVIEDAGKKTTNSFQVEDILIEGVILTEIHRERVFIDNKGRREYIEVDRPDAQSKRRGRGAPAPAAPAVPSLNSEPGLANTPPPRNFKEEGFERKENDITMSCDYRQRLLSSDFTKVLQDAKASPYIVDGELRGFELTRIRQDSIYEKSGMQNGDIVTEVNGVPLRNTAQAIKLLNSLRGAEEIEVRILRANAPMTITLQVKC